MVDAESWVEPGVEWRADIDVVSLQQRFANEGELLATWPAAPFESTSTQCFRLGNDYWIWQSGVGGVRFCANAPSLLAYPSAEVDRSWFQHLVSRSWLPAIYPIWGRQVIHASAVARVGTGDAVAFTGPSCAGKSTTAYGLGRRAGWRPVSDDTLAFSCAHTATGLHIRLHPLRNDARLRPPSAEYYGKSDDMVSEPVEWLAEALQLRAIYCLEGHDEGSSPAEFTRLRASESYVRLLQQAYALSLEIPTYNQQLMRDYVELAANVPVFRLQYRRSFDVAQRLFEALEEHLTSEVGVVAGAGVARPALRT